MCACTHPSLIFFFFFFFFFFFLFFFFFFGLCTRVAQIYLFASPLSHYSNRRPASTLAQVDLLPLVEVVKDDAYMSSPTDPNLMSPDVLAKFRAG